MCVLVNWKWSILKFRPINPVQLPRRKAFMNSLVASTYELANKFCANPGGKPGLQTTSFSWLNLNFCRLKSGKVRLYLAVWGRNVSSTYQILYINLFINLRALKGQRFMLFSEMVACIDTIYFVFKFSRRLMDVLDLGKNKLNNSAIIPSSRPVQSVCAVESPK